MATTLRLDEALYREAKAEAAKRGITITRFIEEALREYITQRTALAAAPQKAAKLPSFPCPGLPDSWEEMKRLASESETEWQLKKLGWKS